MPNRVPQILDDTTLRQIHGSGLDEFYDGSFTQTSSRDRPVVVRDALGVDARHLYKLDECLYYTYKSDFTTYPASKLAIRQIKNHAVQWERTFSFTQLGEVFNSPFISGSGVVYEESSAGVRTFAMDTGDMLTIDYAVPANLPAHPLGLDRAVDSSVVVQFSSGVPIGRGTAGAVNFYRTMEVTSGPVDIGSVRLVDGEEVFLVTITPSGTVSYQLMYRNYTTLDLDVDGNPIFSTRQTIETGSDNFKPGSFTTIHHIAAPDANTLVIEGAHSTCTVDVSDPSVLIGSIAYGTNGWSGVFIVTQAGASYICANERGEFVLWGFGGSERRVCDRNLNDVTPAWIAAQGDAGSTWAMRGNVLVTTFDFISDKVYNYTTGEQVANTTKSAFNRATPYRNTTWIMYRKGGGSAVRRGTAVWFCEMSVAHETINGPLVWLTHFHEGALGEEPDVLIPPHYFHADI